jgi:copper oxidase (laccase) domain-containing protein
LAKSYHLPYPVAVTEVFSFLDPIHAIPGIRAGWVERVPGLELACDRDEAMRHLRSFHEMRVHEFAGSDAAWWRAEQVHGHAVAVVPGAAQIVAPDGLSAVPGVDGLLTNQAGVVLAIYVADCGAVWLADRRTGAIGLLHSGKKGTEQNILGVALERMAQSFGTRAEDVIAVLSPCIRPPDYEIDFAAQIAVQADELGLGNFIDCGLNTAADLRRYYSYRKELGKTGRMMALIVRDPSP